MSEQSPSAGKDRSGDQAIDAETSFEAQLEAALQARAQVETALLQLQEHFRNLSELTYDGASSLKVRPDGTFEMEWITERFSRIMGYPVEEIRTFESWMNLLHPDDRHLIDRELPRLLGGQTVHVELRLIGKAGEVYWVDCTSRPIVDPQSGRVVRFVNALHDVTRSKQAEEDLRQSREFIDRILNAIDDPIFVKDDQHRWIVLNDSSCRLMGYPRQELLGQSDYDLFPGEQADVFWNKDTQVLETGKTDVNEEQITWLDGLHTISTKKSLMVDPVTGKRFIVGTIRDITDRVRMEAEIRLHRDHLEELVRQRTAELEQKHAELVATHEELQRLQRMKDEFTAMISHELRTPLVTGLGYLQMLLSGHLGSLTPEARNKMDVARRNLKRLSSLIDDLLSFHRLSSRDQAYQPQFATVDLEDLIQECVDDFLTRTERPENSIRIQVGRDTPPVLADEDMMRRVMANLLDNVARHAGPGATATLIVALDRPDRVRVEVIDDGVGMPTDVSKIAFDPFVSSSKLGRGAGLGLAIVRYIIEAHGSKVHLKSAPNEGTSVSFSLRAAWKTG